MKSIISAILLSVITFQSAQAQHQPAACEEYDLDIKAVVKREVGQDIKLCLVVSEKNRADYHFGVYTDKHYMTLECNPERCNLKSKTLKQ